MRVLMLATMAIWGGNLSVIKLLLLTYQPMLLSAARMAAATLGLVLIWRWAPAGVARCCRGPRPGGLVGCGFLMVYANQVAFMGGVQRTAAANAALIIALNPLVSTLMAALLLGDRLTPARAAGVVLGFGGVAAVVLHRPGATLGWPTLGDGLVLLSVVAWVGGGLMVQRLARQIDTAVVSTLVTAVGTLMVVLHVLLDPGTQLPPLDALRWWHGPVAAASGFLATAVGALVWNRSLSVLGVARTALYAYWVPIFGVAFAVLLLGEPLTIWHAIGLAAVLTGTWLGTRGH